MLVVSPVESPTLLLPLFTSLLISSLVKCLQFQIILLAFIASSPIFFNWRFLSPPELPISIFQKGCHWRYWKSFTSNLYCPYIYIPTVYLPFFLQGCIFWFLQFTWYCYSFLTGVFEVISKFHMLGVKLTFFFKSNQPCMTSISYISQTPNHVYSAMQEFLQS